jgi:hypothetical protein
MDRQAPVSPGTFAGKTAFASTGAPLRYVTEFEFASGAATIRVPAMSGKVLDPAQRLILYADSDGNTRIQMPSGLWITFHSGLGWLMLSAELADAVAVKLTGNPMGTHWEVNTADGWKRVYYSLDQHSPILSIHGGDGYPDTFSPAIVTPSLAQMRSSKNGVNSDLQKVDLRQETLDEIDFTKAQFSFANLEGATFKKATLTDAMFVEATLRTIYWRSAGRRRHDARPTGWNVLGQPGERARNRPDWLQGARCNSGRPDKSTGLHQSEPGRRGFQRSQPQGMALE